MLEKYLDEYISDLYEKQNIGLDPEQQNLYSRQDYYQLLRPVIDVVGTYKDHSLEELRAKLYERSGIEDKVRDFILKREMVPGMVFSYGTMNFRETIVIGNRQEVTSDKDGNLIPALEMMTEDTIFDLASVTKIFTSLSVLKLVELGAINLSDPVVKYCPQFKNLANVTIFDLLGFRVPLKTKERVDKATSKEDAERILFDIEIDSENNGIKPYTDMGAMILKYLVQKVSGMSFYDFVDQNIITKLGLNDTHIVVPNGKIDRVASTNYGGQYFKDGKYAITTNVPKGTVYDPKAQVMGQASGNLSGHAGLFSTSSDMTSLAKGMIDGKVIDIELIKGMSKNRTGRFLRTNEKGENEYVQYLGFLCYSKNPRLVDSELFHALSGQSLASGGWTGTQLTVDPINQLFFFLGSNRSHNRMTFIDKDQQNKVQVDENGKRTILLSKEEGEGELKIDATRFAWDRDIEVVHPAIKLAIQYQMLEKIFSYQKENGQVDENVRHL